MNGIISAVKTTWAQVPVPINYIIAIIAIWFLLENPEWLIYGFVAMVLLNYFGF